LRPRIKRRRGADELGIYFWIDLSTLAVNNKGGINFQCLWFNVDFGEFEGDDSWLFQNLRGNQRK
jgi:hypothetical protein